MDFFELKKMRDVVGKGEEKFERASLGEDEGSAPANDIQQQMNHSLTAT